MTLRVYRVVVTRQVLHSDIVHVLCDEADLEDLGLPLAQRVACPLDSLRSVGPLTVGSCEALPLGMRIPTEETVWDATPSAGLPGMKVRQLDGCQAMKRVQTPAAMEAERLRLIEENNGQLPLL